MLLLYLPQLRFCSHYILAIPPYTGDRFQYYSLGFTILDTPNIKRLSTQTPIPYSTSVVMPVYSDSDMPFVASTFFVSIPNKGSNSIPQNKIHTKWIHFQSKILNKETTTKKRHCSKVLLFVVYRAAV